MEEAPKPKKQRARKREKNLHQARNDPAKNLFIRMQETPEGRALWKIWTDRRFLKPNGKGPGRPAGSIDGYSGAELRKQRAQAKAEAIKMVDYMIKKEIVDIPEVEYAKEALVAAVESMRMEAINVKDKLAAARLVLEYTKAKPAAKSEVTVKTAEDFLLDIAKDLDQDKE